MGKTFKIIPRDRTGGFDLPGEFVSDVRVAGHGGIIPLNRRRRKPPLGLVIAADGARRETLDSFSAGGAGGPYKPLVQTHHRRPLSQGEGILPLPQSRSIIVTMKTLAGVFALALAAIALGVCSDASLTSAGFSHTKTHDPAALAVARGVQRR